MGTQEYLDVYGMALEDFYFKQQASDLFVHSDITETEKYPTEHFFREFKDFPLIEKKAMKLCKGKILDIGAGSGIHSKHLQESKYDVTALEISERCIDIMRKRGIKQTLLQDFWEINEENQYDTLLMMMNGFGIMGTLEKIPDFLQKASKLLSVNGQILFDSSDLIYMYEEEDGSYLIDISKGYYGEVEYQMEYKTHKGKPFKWLYIDYFTLSDIVEKNGFKIEKICEGNHFDYLARITK